MTSPRPHYAAQGQNYYAPQTPPPAHYNYAPNHAGPSTAYPYHYPVQPAPGHMPVMHHPQPRMNGRGGGVYHPQSRGGHAYQNYHPHQPFVPHAHSNPYAHQPKFPNFTPTYPYPHPPYSPSWQTQQSHTMLNAPSFQNEHVTQQENLSQPVASPTVLSSHPPSEPSSEPSVNPPEPIPDTPTSVDEAPPIEPTTNDQQSSPLFIQAVPPIQLSKWAIWSRRPTDPANAPCLIFSKNTRLPQYIIEGALPDRTPPASPVLVTKDLPPESPVVGVSNEQTPSDTAEDVSPSTVPSSSATVATDTPTIPGSPASSNTSISVAPKEAEAAAAETSSLTVETTSTAETSSLTVETTPAPSSTTETTVETTSPAPAPAPPPVKKSWASLLKPTATTTPIPIKNTLPTSSVMGFSIPADAPSPSAARATTVSSTKKSALLALLNGEVQVAPVLSPTSASFAAAAAASSSSSSSSSTKTADPSKIRPRGLINTGNMCFANSVLQVLLYCPPFFRLFYELGKILPESGLGLEKGDVPLVNATIELLRDFLPREKKGEEQKQVGTSGLRGKGKEKERVVEEEEEWERESFIPTYVYDAMKEKKRFDNMRGGHQEDAEEFLGFYLDTLEEELLAISNTISPPNKGSNSNSMVEEKEEDEPPQEDGWLEVGKRNKTVVTRTIKSTESPITRIFGGKFRSTLKAAGQKDSATVEDWRSLRLDIQRDQILTIQDALSYISHPESVQMTHPTRPETTIEASQQVLIESLPPILVLQMKRFCYDSVGGVVKVGKQVRFASELVFGPDIMAHTVRKPHTTRYKLFGAIYHHGISASGGHYTLDVLHPNRYPSPNPSSGSGPATKPKEGWIRIDDELVSDVRAEDVFGEPEKDDMRCAYLLFYRRMR